MFIRKLKNIERVDKDLVGAVEDGYVLEEGGLCFMFLQQRTLLNFLLRQGYLGMLDEAPDDPIEPVLEDVGRESELPHFRLRAQFDDMEDLQPAELVRLSTRLGSHLPSNDVLEGKLLPEEAISVVEDRPLPVDLHVCSIKFPFAAGTPVIGLRLQRSDFGHGISFLHRNFVSNGSSIGNTFLVCQQKIGTTRERKAQS